MDYTPEDLASSLQLLGESSFDDIDRHSAAQIYMYLHHLDDDVRNEWIATFISKYMNRFAQCYRDRRLDPEDTYFAVVLDKTLSLMNMQPLYRHWLTLPVGAGFIEFAVKVFELECPSLQDLLAPDVTKFSTACRQLNDYAIVIFPLLSALEDPFPPAFFASPTTKSLATKLRAIHNSEDKIKKASNQPQDRVKRFEDAAFGLDVLVGWMEGTKTPENVRERSRLRGGSAIGYDCAMLDLVGYDMPDGTPVEECREVRKGESLMACGRCQSVVYCSSLHQKLDWTHHKAECKKPLYE